MTPPKSIETTFTKQFNINYPIVCAPMFLVSTVPMVVAASEAGGMGTFPAFNYRPIENYRQAIREIKSKTDKPFGINIIVQDSNKYQTKQVAYALEEGVDLLITSLGKPKDIIQLAHQAGSKVYCDVVNVHHAQKVVDLGADGLIAVGSGAGGHAGETSPLVLIPQLAEKFDVPVLAAGSIVDGAGMAAALSLGAAGIYMGTRFIASQEAEVGDDYKQAIISSGPEDIVNTERVDGFPGNFIYTKALQRVGLKKGFFESIVSKNKRIKKWIALSRAARSLFGSPSSKVSYKTIFSAGHGVGRIDAILPIAEIIHKTAREYRNIVKKLPG